MEQARNVPAFIFDLDGTLVDSVYQHVLARRKPWSAVALNLPYGAFIVVSA